MAEVLGCGYEASSYGQAEDESRQVAHVEQGDDAEGRAQQGRQDAVAPEEGRHQDEQGTDDETAEVAGVEHDESRASVGTGPAGLVHPHFEAQDVAAGEHGADAVADLMEEDHQDLQRREDRGVPQQEDRCHSRGHRPGLM